VKSFVLDLRNNRFGPVKTGIHLTLYNCNLDVFFNTVVAFFLKALRLQRFGKFF
jgi:hypothetical protein